MKKFTISQYRLYKMKGNELIKKLGFEHKDVIAYYTYLERYAKGEPFAEIGLKKIYLKYFKKVLTKPRGYDTI